jgi:thioredoxin reductase (NADPH)
MNQFVIERNSVQSTDVVIIGAGPVGLFGIFQCGMLGLKCEVIDTLDFIGGQCVALYPEKPIYDIPGFPSVLGQDLIQQLEKQAAHFNPVYHLGHSVTAMTQDENGWVITSHKGLSIHAKTVLIASGGGAFGPNRPPLDGIEEYEKTSVFYAVHKRSIFKDKTVVIAGGGDSAVDWAVSLSSVAKKIYMVHRRDNFRAAPETVSQMLSLVHEGQIELVTPYQLSGLEGKNGRLTGVEVSTLEGEKRILEADFLLPFFGLHVDLGAIENWGLNIDHKHLVVNPATLETNLKGVFAIGDAAVYPGKLKLILCGFSEAAMAAHAIRSHIFPDKVFSFQHSTSQAGTTF